MSCSCSKLFLIAVNFVFVLTGVCLLLLGYFTKSYSENGCYVLIVCGCTLSLVSMLGLLGAGLEVSLLLMTYSLCVLLSMLLPVGGALLTWQPDFALPANQFLHNQTQTIMQNYQLGLLKEENVSASSIPHIALVYTLPIFKKIEEGWLIENKYLVTAVAGGVLSIQLFLIILTICTNRKVLKYHSNSVSNSASTVTSISTISTISGQAFAPSAPDIESSSYPPLPPSYAPPPPPPPPPPSNTSSTQLLALNGSCKIHDQDNTQLSLHPFAVDPLGPVEAPAYYTHPNNLDFDCKVCMYPMTPPKKIYQCKDGHALCESCSDNPAVTSCPFCRRPLDGGRNLALEELAEQYFKRVT